MVPSLLVLLVVLLVQLSAAINPSDAAVALPSPVAAFGGSVRVARGRDVEP